MVRSPESLATAIRRVLDEPQFGEAMRSLREKEASCRRGRIQFSGGAVDAMQIQIAGRGAGGREAAESLGLAIVNRTSKLQLSLVRSLEPLLTLL